jgi:hypothetical protein
VLLHVELEHDEPVAGLEVTAFPFDAEAILDSLEAAAAEPRPAFPELERQLAAYRSPEDDRLSEASRPWLALYDSVSRLADSLNTMDRRTQTYARMYERFRQLYGRLQQRAAERDRALEELRGEDVALARRAQAAAESVRVWERAAFEPYAELHRAALDSSGRAVALQTTDDHGEAHLELAAGDWWIVARLTDPDNPFQEYYWSVHLRTTGWLPLRVPLFERNRLRRWRH